MKVSERDSGPLQVARLRLLFAAAWHVGRGGDQELERVEAAASTPAVTKSGLSLDMTDVITLNGVSTQVGTTLVRLMSQEDYDNLFPVYVESCGSPMAEGLEPTRVQTSA